MTTAKRERFVYLLEAIDGRPRSYIGWTINLGRRLRQHNGEISGGARSTRGRKWRLHTCVGGFPDDASALHFEYVWKHPTRVPLLRRLGVRKGSMVAGRLKCVVQLRARVYAWLDAEVDGASHRERKLRDKWAYVRLLFIATPSTLGSESDA